MKEVRKNQNKTQSKNATQAKNTKNEERKTKQNPKKKNSQVKVVPQDNKQTKNVKSEKKKSEQKSVEEEFVKEEEVVLVKKGIPKFWSTYIVELLYIFLLEVLVKIISGSFSFDYSLLRIFLSSNILAFLISLITTNLKQGLRLSILIIINFFITFYAWLQLGFLNFIGAYMSLGNAEQGTKITDYIGDFLASYELPMFAIFIPYILTLLYLIFEQKITKAGYSSRLSLKNGIADAAMIVYILLLGLAYYGSLTIPFMQNKFQSIPNKSLFKYPSSPSIAIKNFGMTVYFGLDVKGTILGGETEIGDYTILGSPNEVSNSREIDNTAWEYITENETDKSYTALNNYFINKTITDKNDYTGLFEGKNLIMIMMESIGSAVFESEYAEYFPTLHKMYNEGITGVNNFSPRNNCATGESEMTAQVSLYSISTTCTVNTYKNNEYKEALLYMMQNNGYYTSSYHDYSDTYYSRNTYERKMGSIKYYGATNLGLTLDYRYEEWPSDYDFMRLATPKFINEEKFASFMITVSAHTPYKYYSTIGNKHLKLFSDLEVSTSTKRYLSKVKELDLALEYLLTELENAGKLDDTVIVLYGDHYPYGLSDKEYQSMTSVDISVNADVDRTPFIIYNSETEAEKITKYTTPLDYLPTLLNLFGIDFDPRYYMGHDVFSEYTDYAVFPDNSWQSDFGYYDASKGVFLPTNIEEEYDEEQIISINNEVNTMRTMSGLAIKKNYFKYLYQAMDDYYKMVETEESLETESET